MSAEPDNPYVGLRPFESADSFYFFGRREQTAELLELLHRSRFLAVVGSSGCGKSSLVNIISGLYRADEGSILIGGKSFHRVPAHRLAELGVARTFQNLALFPRLSVRANIASGLVHIRNAGIVGQVLGLSGARREDAEVAEILARYRSVI